MEANKIREKSCKNYKNYKNKKIILKEKDYNFEISYFQKNRKYVFTSTMILYNKIQVYGDKIKRKYIKI